MSTATQPTLSSAQMQIIRNLHQQFDIDPGRVYFIGKGEPWLPADVLSAIGRATGKIKSIDEDYKEFIPQRNQVVHKAIVVDVNDNVYGRSGVATIGETLPDMEAGEEVDEHDLAASRAIVKALNLAGVNPFKSGSIVSLDDRRQQPAGPRTVEEARIAEAASRTNDLARIHMLAADAGMIESSIAKGGDRKYRDWLLANYKVHSAAELNETERASVVAALEAVCRELA